MAYPGAQRPYAGMAAQRPGPRAEEEEGLTRVPHDSSLTSIKKIMAMTAASTITMMGMVLPQAGTMDEEALEDIRKTIMGRRRVDQAEEDHRHRWAEGEGP
ncbi:hypothetical protein PG990_012673 [Apiospora arundinis]